MRKIIIILLLFTGSVFAQTYTETNLFIQDSMKVGLADNSIWIDTIKAGSIVISVDGMNYIMNGTTDEIAGADWYISPTGDDVTGDGTIENPWLSWDRANDSLSAGDTVFIRGGTYTAQDEMPWYQYRFSGIAGARGNPITIMAYPGEMPVWSVAGGISTALASTAVLIDDCDWVNFKGLTLGPTPQVDGYNVIYGWDIINSSHITLIECVGTGLSGAGFTVGNELWGRIANSEVSDSIMFFNCDATRNEDPYSGTAYGGADGFNISHNTSGDPVRNMWVTNVVFGGCSSLWNSDDGIDFFRADSGLMTIDSCLFAYNGYHYSDTSNTGDGQGMKMGPNATDFDKYEYAQFIVRRTVSIHNRDANFDQNTSTSYHSSGRTFYNNFAYSAYIGIEFYNISPTQDNPTPVLTNNVSFDNSDSQITFNGDDFVTDTYNSWNGVVTVNAADYVSLVIDVEASRDANGNIVWGTFGQLAEGSDLIDAGTDVGLPYEGTAPDMGVFESNY